MGLAVTRRRVLLGVLMWPFGVGALWLLVRLLPVGSMWGQAVAAVAWSGPPVAAALWPLWTLGVVWWRGPWTGPRLHLWGPVVGLSVLGAGRPVGWSTEPAGELTVAVWNVNAYSPQNGAPQDLEDAVHQAGLDVVVFVEKRVETLPRHTRVADDFAQDWPRASHHTAVWRNDDVVVQARISEQVGSESMAMPVAVVWLDDVDTCLLGLHAPPQVPKNPTGMVPHIEWLVAHLPGGRTLDLAPCPDGSPAVLAGDLNHVPGSWPYRTLLSVGLDDEVGPAGLYGTTWPSGGGWPDLPLLRLDHVLAHPAVVVRRLHKRRIPGSDHQGWVFSLGPAAR